MKRFLWLALLAFVGIAFTGRLRPAVAPSVLAAAPVTATEDEDLPALVRFVYTKLSFHANRYQLRKWTYEKVAKTPASLKKAERPPGRRAREVQRPEPLAIRVGDFQTGPFVRIAQDPPGRWATTPDGVESVPVLGPVLLGGPEGESQWRTFEIRWERPASIDLPSVSQLLAFLYRKSGHPAIDAYASFEVVIAAGNKPAIRYRALALFSPKPKSGHRQVTIIDQTLGSGSFPALIAEEGPLLPLNGSPQHRIAAANGMNDDRQTCAATELPTSAAFCVSAMCCSQDAQPSGACCWTSLGSR